MSWWSEFVQHTESYQWLLLVGLSLLALAGFLFYRKCAFLKRSRTSIGKLVSLERRSAMEGNLWCTRIAFEDEKSEKHEVEFTSSEPGPSYVKTGTLKVYYDPSDPQKAYSSEIWRLWLWEMVIALLAFMVLWAAWVNY